MLVNGKEAKDLSEIELIKIYKKFEGFEKLNDSDLTLKIASIFYLSLRKTGQYELFENLSKNNR